MSPFSSQTILHLLLSPQTSAILHSSHFHLMVSIISLREVTGRDFRLLPPSLPIHLHLTVIFCLPACQQWVSCLCYSRDITPAALPPLFCSINFPLLPRSLPWAYKTCCNFHSFKTKQNKTGIPKCLSFVTYSESDPSGGFL